MCYYQHKLLAVVLNVMPIVFNKKGRQRYDRAGGGGERGGGK